MKFNQENSRMDTLVESLKDNDSEEYAYDQEKVAEAFQIIKQAMIDDEPSEEGSFAHSWHCNIAMSYYDAMSDDATAHLGHEECHRIANDGASRFMKLCFDVETSARTASSS